MTPTNAIQLRLPPQDPSAIEDYRVVFDDTIASLLPGVSISGISWSVVAPPGDLLPLAVVAFANATDFSYSDVRLSGGTLLSEYRLRALVSLSNGEIYPVSTYIIVDYT